MKRYAVTYALFILSMTAFIAFRIYAGKAVAARAVSETTDTAVETQPEETVKPDTPEPEETVKEPDIPEDPTEYLWHGTVFPVNEYDGKERRIICWGDSLTVSLDQKSAFPDILRDLSGCEVVNYGVEAENTEMIAMREGAVRVNVRATVIPSDTNLIPVFLRTEDNKNVHFLDHGDGGVNPCSIMGIEGKLEKLNGSYYFKRTMKGERIAVDEGTLFVTHAMADSSPEDILVIFAGTNDLPDSKSVSHIIDLEKKMIEKAGCEKYIIIGLTYAGGIPEIEKVNEALSNEFKDHFVDIRKYMMDYGLADAGIEPTANDLADIKKGEIPSSLRSDHIHGNRIYHSLLGKQVYRRMKYLGYLENDEEDI